MPEQKRIRLANPETHFEPVLAGELAFLWRQKESTLELLSIKTRTIQPFAFHAPLRAQSSEIAWLDNTWISVFRRSWTLQRGNRIWEIPMDAQYKNCAPALFLDAHHLLTRATANRAMGDRRVISEDLWLQVDIRTGQTQILWKLPSEVVAWCADPIDRKLYLVYRDGRLVQGIWKHNRFQIQNTRLLPHKNSYSRLGQLVVIPTTSWILYTLTVHERRSSFSPDIPRGVCYAYNITTREVKTIAVPNLPYSRIVGWLSEKPMKPSHGK